ncbi:MAG TPA: cupredoxin domain-containing protein [Candidatus Saccharimonadales bacterium]|nr:cupredoxin domain-containing protein [Candidatus Saccharimonadales bacterium]
MEEQTSPTPPGSSGMSYTKYVIIVVLVLIIVLGGIYAYKSSHQSTVPTQQMQPTPSTSSGLTATSTMMQSATAAPTEKGTASSEAMQNETQKITVTASNFTFDPKTITVKKGQPVELTFKNSEGMHDLVIDEFNVKTKVIPGGQSETISFTPNKTGTFNYYCSVGNHRAMGMQGTITVE